MLVTGLSRVGVQSVMRRIAPDGKHANLGTGKSSRRGMTRWCPAATARSVENTLSKPSSNALHQTLAIVLLRVRVLYSGQRGDDAHGGRDDGGASYKVRAVVVAVVARHDRAVERMGDWFERNRMKCKGGDEEGWGLTRSEIVHDKGSALFKSQAMTMAVTSTADNTGEVAAALARASAYAGRASTDGVYIWCEADKVFRKAPFAALGSGRALAAIWQCYPGVVERKKAIVGDCAYNARQCLQTKCMIGPTPTTILAFLHMLQRVSQWAAAVRRANCCQSRSTHTRNLDSYRV
ncbi:hypothetical protein FGB62_89g011 [Gracilaria domingensis]|nr:hypothetical protein FGB62_89g011 [Gracilaria domingensis]